MGLNFKPPAPKTVPKGKSVKKTVNLLKQAIKNAVQPHSNVISPVPGPLPKLPGGLGGTLLIELGTQLLFPPPTAKSALDEIDPSLIYSPNPPVEVQPEIPQDWTGGQEPGTIYYPIATARFEPYGEYSAPFVLSGAYLYGPITDTWVVVWGEPKGASFEYEGINPNGTTYWGWFGYQAYATGKNENGEEWTKNIQSGQCYGIIIVGFAPAGEIEPDDTAPPPIQKKVTNNQAPNPLPPPINVNNDINLGDSSNYVPDDWYFPKLGGVPVGWKSKVPPPLPGDEIPQPENFPNTVTPTPAPKPAGSNVGSKIPNTVTVKKTVAGGGDHSGNYTQKFINTTPNTKTVPGPFHLPGAKPIPTPEEFEPEPEEEKPPLPEPPIDPTTATIIATLVPQITQIQKNTEPEQIKTNVEEAICDSSTGGCLKGNVTDPITNSINNPNWLSGLLDSLNFAQLDGITDKLNDLDAFLKKAWQSTKADKILNLINTALILHNAVMLSNSAYYTITEIIDNVFITFGIKDHEGNDIDVSNWIGNKIQTIIQSIIGVETYENLSTTLKKGNRIYQATANVLWGIRDIMDSTQNIAELTSENVSVIGNALKKSGVVRENSYPNMPEQVNATNGFIKKMTDIQEGLDLVEEVSEETVDIKENFDELTENKQEFNDSLNSWKETKDLEDTENKFLLNSLVTPQDTDTEKAE